MFHQKSSIKSSVGFSLTELMVVFVIIGILATMAIPRFREFIATSRQGEVKLNLGQFSKLQHLYMTAKEEYLAIGVAPTDVDTVGNATTGIGLVTNSSGEKQTSACNTADMKKIGFRAAGCANWRYSYWSLKTTTNGVDRFIIGAYGPSTPTTRIFPTCDGTKQEGTTTARSPVVLNHSLGATGSGAGTTMTITPQAGGDTWMIDDQRKMHSDSMIPVCKGESGTGHNIGS